MPNRGQQVPVIAQENLKLAAVLSYHRKRFTFDWKVMVVCDDTVCLLAGQKRLEDDCKDPGMVPKVNKADMAGTVVAIKEYLRLYYGIMRAPHSYMKTKTVQTYGDYPRYVTPDVMIIVGMLHFSPDRINFF